MNNGLQPKRFNALLEKPKEDKMYLQNDISTEMHIVVIIQKTESANRKCLAIQISSKVVINLNCYGTIHPTYYV